MSLSAAMEIGRSALAASSLGIQIAGNNMANASTPGYSRQVGRFMAIRGDGSIPGVSIGGGVQVGAVQRQVDTALQGRVWGSTSDQSAARAQSQIFSQVESTLGELGNNDLSSQLSAFFQGWSEQGNQSPTAGAVIQQGDQLASFVRQLRGNLTDQRTQIDSQLSAGVDQANQLLNQVAGLNTSIAQAEVGGATANVLRDQRDSAITQLSTLMDVTVVDHGSQGMDVLVGSTPVVLGGQSRGLQLNKTVVNGQTQVSVATVADGADLTVNGGSIEAQLAQRTNAIDGTVQKLDQLASQLIFQVNKLHSTGHNRDGLTQTTGTLGVPTSDRSLALDDPNNPTFGSLPFKAVNGGFMVNVRDKNTGAVSERADQRGPGRDQQRRDRGHERRHECRGYPVAAQRRPGAVRELHGRRQAAGHCGERLGLQLLR